MAHRPAPPSRRRLAPLAAPLALLAGAALAAGCGASLPQTPVVSIAPAAVTLQAGGGQQQFTATVLNATNTAVVWKVNNLLGGNATAGTITQAGLYSAPAAVPSGAVAVEAVSMANANSQAAAVVTLTAPVAVSLTPATATVVAGGSLQFSAVVANAANTAVTWSVNATPGGSAATGTISPSGLYTAPAAFPGLNTVTIGVASVQDPQITASAVVTLAQPIVVTVTPATASVNVGATQAFLAAVTGTSNTAVTWSVNSVAGGSAALGAIDANGNFTAPAAIPAPATETITATSQADPTKSGSAQVTIVAPVAVTVSPATASLKAGQTQQFTATVTNATNTAVTWSVNGTAGGSAQAGTISANGLYTVPATFPGLNTVTIGVASVQDPAATASAVVTLIQPVAVTLTPATATVNLGATQQFLATVTGSANTAVTWTVNTIPGGNATLGTIDATGLFTAPKNLPAPATETVTATSQADATQSASAQLTLQIPPAAFAFSPASASLSLPKAASGTATFQLAVSAGFTTPINLTVSGLPANVTATVSPSALTASGPVVVTLTTAAISLAASAVPVTLTATSAPGGGPPLVQAATVLLTITGWAGHVSTLAGGPGGVGFQDGTGAQDELEASALASDGGQTLYFADQRGSALRSYGLVNQTVTTLVGGPYAFSFPDTEGLVYDSANQTLYAADAQRNQVLAFAVGGFAYTVVAGSGLSGYADGVGKAAQFASPHGLALSADQSTLYVADTNNELIRAVDIASGTVSTLAGQKGVYRSTDGVGAAASFCQPTGLALDSAGANLYISDQCGYVIRRLALGSATVTTVAGSGTIGQADGAALAATFKSLGGLLVDPHAGSPLLYIADANKIRVLTLGASPNVFTLAGTSQPGQSDGNAGQASFYSPLNFAALADNVGPGTTSLFVADTLNGLLRRVDISNPLTASTSASITVTTLAGQPSHRGASDGAGTGADYSAASVATFSQPEGIVTDGTTAYVADSVNGAIRKIDLASSQVSTVAGPAQGYADGPATGGAAFFQNAGLAWLPSQNVIYIADTGNGAIRKLDLATQTVSTIAGTDAAGYVDGPLLSARFNHPYGILVSPDGTKLYVADTGNNAIRLVDLTAGAVSTIAGNGGLGSADGIGPAARFAEPNGLAFDATGNNIFISDFENHAIRELNLTTLAVTTLVGAAHHCGFADGPAASATLCTPAFIATDGRSLFWGDSDTGLLRVLDLNAMQVYTLAGDPGVMHMVDGDLLEKPGALVGPVRYNGVFGLAVAPDASFVLFTDKTANVVRILH
ncbi:MAG TPA: hypothetical protein VMV31_10025 [Terriglobales bacterium]|nr:hypothetical protein [Terriglobales bacterium]